MGNSFGIQYLKRGKDFSYFSSSASPLPSTLATFFFLHFFFCVCVYGLMNFLLPNQFAFIVLFEVQIEDL